VAVVMPAALMGVPVPVVVMLLGLAELVTLVYV
jgi:hypothetical protein